MTPKTKLADKKHDFELAFQGLRKIETLRQEAAGGEGWPDGYMSESKSIRYLGKPLMFAGLTTKSYVCVSPFSGVHISRLANGISPELKKRMQGKTCWNFKKAEQPLFAELGRFVEASFQRFEELGERDLTREDAQALWGKSKGKAKSKKK